MPKANEVATELRKLADALDLIDPNIIVDDPLVCFTEHSKESFVALARVMPRPIKKDVLYGGKDFAELRLQYKSAIVLWVKVPQSLTCELIEPAKPAVYRCDPILSEAEESMLEVS